MASIFELVEDVVLLVGVGEGLKAQVSIEIIGIESFSIRLNHLLHGKGLGIKVANSFMCIQLESKAFLKLLTAERLASHLVERQVCTLVIQMVLIISNGYYCASGSLIVEGSLHNACGSCYAVVRKNGQVRL